MRGSTYNKCPQTTDARDIDWLFCDLIGDLGTKNIEQTPFPRDEWEGSGPIEGWGGGG